MAVSGGQTMGHIEIKGPRARATELRTRYRLTAADIAQATSTDERTVRRWGSVTETRRSPVDSRIRQLEKVIAALHNAGLSNDSVRFWLREPAEYLDDRSPLSALGDGDVAAVEQFVEVSTLGISVGRSGRGGRGRKRSPRQAAVGR
jgi:hypothetical protein